MATERGRTDWQLRNPQSHPRCHACWNLAPCCHCGVDARRRHPSAYEPVTSHEIAGLAKDLGLVELEKFDVVQAAEEIARQSSGYY